MEEAFLFCLGWTKRGLGLLLKEVENEDVILILYPFPLSNINDGFSSLGFS